uniref:F-box domain-containing protein n=1 Tax=Meloidogyne incognita TaxID=6306 RepID=A0A914KYJ1_MELIC
MDIDSKNKNILRDSLSSEVLTDIFSFLPRKKLIKNVEPVNKYFFELSKENVKSAHLITKNENFIKNLANNLEEAKQQYLNLSSSECSLAEHFGLKNVFNVVISSDEKMNNSPQYKRRCRYQMCVLRHSLDIFKNCFIKIDTLDFGKNFTDSDLQEILAYLNILDSVCPSRITLELHHSIHQTPVHLRYQICQELLNNQAILNCQLLEIFNDKIFNEPSVDSLFNWLHYKKINFDNPCRNLCLMKYNMANELIEKCKKNLLESVSTEDCRSYLLIFHSNKILNEFSLENTKSGEIILMKNIKDLSVEDEVKCYSLTRCQLNMEEGVIRNYFSKLFDTRFESLPLIRIH